jgi:hypothetical protein
MITQVTWQQGDELLPVLPVVALSKLGSSGNFVLETLSRHLDGTRLKDFAKSGAWNQLQGVKSKLKLTDVILSKT